MDGSLYMADVTPLVPTGVILRGRLATLTSIVTPFSFAKHVQQLPRIAFYPKYFKIFLSIVPNKIAANLKLIFSLFKLQTKTRNRYFYYCCNILIVNKKTIFCNNINLFSFIKMSQVTNEQFSKYKQSQTFSHQFIS